MYEKELKVAKKAAEKAGKILIKYHRKELEISNKIGVDIVTNADLEAEKLIVNTLKKSFQNYGILAEESGVEGNQKTKWIIDPLDGTMNFSRGSEIFGTTIALEKDGEIVLGLIYLPKHKEMFTAIKGKGTFLNKKRINVSNRKGESSIIIIGGGWFSKESEKFNKNLTELANKYPNGFRRYGSAIYGLAMIGCGRSEAMLFHHTKSWDISAGALLVEEAGGLVTNLKGEKWNPYQGNYVFSNGKIHKEILGIINK